MVYSHVGMDAQGHHLRATITQGQVTLGNVKEIFILLFPMFNTL